MVRLIFDCLRAPYDLANTLQVALATGKCEIHLTGNSLRHDHPKVLGKVSSWSKRIRANGLPAMAIHYWPSLEDCAKALKAQGIRLIGTSPHGKASFYDLICAVTIMPLSLARNLTASHATNPDCWTR